MAQGYRRVAVTATSYRYFFLGSDVEAKRGIKLRHSTRHASRIWGKVGNGYVLVENECLNTKFPLPTLLYARYSVKLKKNIVNKNHNGPSSNFLAPIGSIS